VIKNSFSDNNPLRLRIKLVDTIMFCELRDLLCKYFSDFDCESKYAKIENIGTEEISQLQNLSYQQFDTQSPMEFYQKKKF